MRRTFSLLVAVLLPLAATAAPKDFEGFWSGEIVAPNARASFGLAFTPTPRGLLVSVQFPEMFLYGTNFGAAEIQDDTFTLEPLNLVLTRTGDELRGTFAIGRLPVHLRRGGTFSEAPPTSQFPEGPAPLWTRSLGAPLWASPAIFENTVYVGATDGRFHAVDATSGEIVWSWTGPHPLYGEALATADAVYFVDDRTDLICLERSTGALRWRLPLHNAELAGGPPPKNETFNHRTPTPVIDSKGMLYVGSTDGGLYAIRTKAGAIAWRHDAKTRIYASVTLRGDDLIAGGYDGSVFLLNRRNRRERFRVKLGGPVVSAPVVAGDRIIVGARDYFLYGLDAANGTTRWRTSYWFSWIESTPRFFDNTLYVGGSDFRRISAIAPRDGRILWSTDVRGLSWGSPVVTNTHVYAGTAGQTIEGTVIEHTGSLVALSRSSGAVEWRQPTEPLARAAFNGFPGSLAITGNTLIGARADGTLTAVPLIPASAQAQSAGNP